MLETDKAIFKSIASARHEKSSRLTAKAVCTERAIILYFSLIDPLVKTVSCKQSSTLKPRAKPWGFSPWKHNVVKFLVLLLSPNDLPWVNSIPLSYYWVISTADACGALWIGDSNQNQVWNTRSCQQVFVDRWPSVCYLQGHSCRMSLLLRLIRWSCSEEENIQGYALQWRTWHAFDKCRINSVQNVCFAVIAR